ncbi:MAG: DNA alkylation repair protein [Anaerolineales bacterium]|nr:DNA alkylation repair protein [Anaerolineales bacterium]
MTASASQILAQLRSLADPAAVEGMARYGINPSNTLGIAIPVLRKIARQAGRDHNLALELWASGVHEARLLACFIDDPRQVSAEQMESWAQDFDSWDIVDQCCNNLFYRTPFAYPKAEAWCCREEEFTKRAGFAMLASLAVHDKHAPDRRFEPFLRVIVAEASDERNYVKKAVNWALRQIGKRNPALNALAIQCAEEMLTFPSRAARWNARDAQRELTSSKVRARLGLDEN